MTFAEMLGSVYFFKYSKKILHVQQKYLLPMKYNLPPAFFIFTNHPDECIIFCRFIEYGEYKNNYYGTSIDSVRSVLAKNKVCLLDVQPHVSKQSMQFPSVSCRMSE